MRLMRLSQVQKLLTENGYTYETKIVPSSVGFYRSKGFHPRRERGPFWLLTIPNPNHSKNIELIFADASQDPPLYDLEFGGFWYEWFDCREEDLHRELLEEIRRILSEQTYVIFVTDAKTGNWCGDFVYYDLPQEDMNDMEAFRRKISQIQRPKSLLRKCMGRSRVYELFTWKTYQRIVK